MRLSLISLPVVLMNHAAQAEKIDSSKKSQIAPSPNELDVTVASVNWLFSASVALFAIRQMRRHFPAERVAQEGYRGLTRSKEFLVFASMAMVSFYMHVLMSETAQSTYHAYKKI